MKKKVLHLIGDLSTGGAQSVVMNYLRSMDNDPDYEIIVATNKRSGETDYEAEAKQNGYSVDFLEYKESGAIPVIRSIINWINYQYAIYKAIKRVKPDIIHTHITRIFPHAVFPILLSGTKARVHTLHSDPYAIENKYMPWAKAAFNLFGFYPVCVTEAQSEKAKKRYGFKNCTVIQNGLDLEKFHFSESKADIRKSFDIADDAFVIGFVGRLHKVKNIEFLLSVFGEYRKKNPNAVLVIAGDGSEMDNIQKKAKETNIFNYVKFLGMRSDVERIYKMLDVFMLTSFFESSSIVTVEAQLSGVRCVIADSIPENVVITNNVYRLGLSEPIDKWTDAVDGKGDVFPQKSTPEDYSIKTSVLKLKQLYDSVIKH